jgi:hypothetical protein
MRVILWIISHDNRFKQLVHNVGLNTFWRRGNAWRLVPNYFGYPWEPSKRDFSTWISYKLRSKYNNSFHYFSWWNDRRTGFIQAEMLFRSLKVLNRPVDLWYILGLLMKLLETEITANVWIKCYVPMSFQRTLDKIEVLLFIEV